MRPLLTCKRLKLNLVKKRNIFILLVYIVVTLAVKSQDLLTYKYFVGTTDPDTNWKALTFDDAAWSQGFGSIGYGDNDDSTRIETTSSVYVRYSLRFNGEYGYYKGIIIYPDFDDGFIAYLNGVEILRVNIADSIQNPGHLQTTNRSHEAEGYRAAGPLMYNMPGYYIDSLKLADCAFDTLNMLAFAVFNDSVNGSDLTFNFHYVVIDSSTYENNINLNYIAKPATDSTQLPIIVIETNEYGVYDSSVIASMGIITNSSGRYNRLTDSFTDYDGRIRLKLHGTYSLRFPKKSLRIELQDSTGDNNNVSILGLPAENDFILYAPFQDRTLIKNVFTYNLGHKMGYYEPRTRFCELVLNGNDLGLHVLIEKIKRDKNRVDITKLNSDDNSGTNVTGGYILQYNSGLEIVYPDPKDITPEQQNYILGFIDKCEDLIGKIDYCSTVNEYKNYIDLGSLADYYLINELSLNFDAFSRSWYMYKDNDAVDGRLIFSPLWDYDVAWYYYRGQWAEGWRNNYSPILSFGMIKGDTSFIHLVINKWNHYRTGILSNDAFFGLIDSLTTAIAPAIERNYRIWPDVQYTEYGQYVGLTYDEWLGETKTWIADRLQWMDENIDGLEIDPGCYSSNYDHRLDKNDTEVVNCYPNPFTDQLYIQLYTAQQEDINIRIYNLTGIELYAEHFLLTEGNNRIRVNIAHTLAPGFYTLIITKGNELIHRQKIIRVN